MPSYAALPEQKYMLNNAKRKRKRNRENEEFITKMQHKLKHNRDLQLSDFCQSSESDILFDTQAVNSIENAPIYTDMFSEHISLASNLTNISKQHSERTGQIVPTNENKSERKYDERGDAEFDLGSFQVIVNDFAENYTETEQSENAQRQQMNILEKGESIGDGMQW